MPQTIFELSDLATQAQAKIQQDFPHIDPVIGIRQNMRQAGIAADVLTIDCRRSHKRFIFIIKDSAPDMISYQLTMIDNEGSEYKSIAASKLSVDVIYSWIKQYFC
jgi:hypothetical protein